MEKFKQVPQNFLLKKILHFWGNVVKNYDDNIRDDDFFDVIDRSFERDKAVDLIRAAYSERCLSAIGNSKFRSRRVDLDDDSIPEIFTGLWNSSRSRTKCKLVLEHIKDYILEDCENAEKEALETRFSDLQRLLKLSDLESEILLLAYIHQQTCFSWPCRVENRDKILYYAMALDCSFAEVSKVMTANSKLRKFNLLDDDWDFSRSTLDCYFDGTGENVLERRFYKKSEETDILPWSFYGDLARNDGATLKEMLGACKGKLNILLYGAPGTGKTSFALSLAREMGLKAFEIRQGDANGKNMNAAARMMGIQICNDQEDPAEGLIIVDEADELLRGGFNPYDFSRSRNSTEKGVTNSILDGLKMPTIWISNAPASEMDESVRRRFDYSICFARLNQTQRVSIWKNLVAKHNLGDLISEAKIDAFAAQYATSAGGISTVLANVSRMKPAASEVDELVSKLMKPHCRLMGITAGEKFLPAKDYSLEGLNIKGKVKLDKIVKAVRNYLDADFNAASVDKPRMNILMHGAPGTGKSEFCKYLGKTLDRKVIVINPTFHVRK